MDGSNKNNKKRKAKIHKTTQSTENSKKTKIESNTATKSSELQLLSYPSSSVLTYSDDSSFLILPSFASNQIEDRFSYLFGNVCRRFMYDNCTNNPNTCKLEHRFPTQQLFRTRLGRIGFNGATAMYDTFMLRCNKMFELYFADIVAYFAENNAFDKICQMGNDCILRHKYAFLETVTDGLSQRHEYAVVLKMMLESLKYRNTLVNKAIVQLILCSKNNNITQFFALIDDLSRQKDFHFSLKSINYMLKIFSETKNERLSTILHKIIDEKTSSKVDKDLLGFLRSQTSKNIISN